MASDMRLFIGALLVALVFGCPSHAKDPVVGEEEVGLWTIEKIVNKMNDKPRFYAFAGNAKGSFGVKCDAVMPRSIYVEYDSTPFLGDGGSPHRFFNYRVDTDKMHSGWWEHDKYSAFQLDRDKAAQFLSDISNGHHVLVRASTYDDNTVENEFDIDGAADMVLKMKANCQD